MVRDFAHEDMSEVRELREKHIVARRYNIRDTMLAVREEILDLAYRVDKKPQSGRPAAITDESSAPGLAIRAHPDFTNDIARLATRLKDRIA